MQFLLGVFLGFCIGVCASFGIVTYLGHREIAKRNRRATNWQKVKKEVDKEIMKEWSL